MEVFKETKWSQRSPQRLNYKQGNRIDQDIMLGKDITKFINISL